MDDGATSPGKPAPATEILGRARRGDAGAAKELFELAYDELRTISARMFRDRAATLQPTALVHEAFLRLVDAKQASYADRAHFIGVAVTAMRHILIERARRRGSQKRGGDRGRVPISSIEPPLMPGSDDLLHLDDALQELRKLDERQARVVELRVFGGLGVAETASVLSVSTRTVEGDWRAARAWLGARLVE